MPVQVNATGLEELCVDSFLQGDFNIALRAFVYAAQLRAAGDKNSVTPPLDQITAEEFEEFAADREAEGNHPLAAKARAKAAELRSKQESNTPTQEP